MPNNIHRVSFAIGMLSEAWMPNTRRSFVSLDNYYQMLFSGKKAS